MTFRIGAMPFPRTVPRLAGDGVTLRAHLPSDAGAVLEQCRDPLSREWTTVPLDYTYRDAQEFVSRAMPAGWDDDTEWSFAVEALDGDVPRFAGTVSLRNEGHGRAEIAYGSHPWVRGRGHMETALRLLLDWGFDERGLRTVAWWANRGNWGSRKLAWRLGFAVEGAPRAWLVHRGELRDCWVGTLLAGDARHPTTPWYDVPRLLGRGIVLRRHEQRDAARMVEACSDRETAGWIGAIPQPFGMRDAERFIAEREEQPATGRGVGWAVADAGTDELVAQVDLFDVNRGAGAELGYWVHPAARGRGVATESCRLALRHAFVPEEAGGLGLARVHAHVAEGNDASLRVLEKAGMTQQGRRRRALRLGDGSLADAVLLDVIAEMRADEGSEP
jgi:RimJ/RimL family protein N-acetyltransferase